MTTSTTVKLDQLLAQVRSRTRAPFQSNAGPAPQTAAPELVRDDEEPAQAEILEPSSVEPPVSAYDVLRPREKAFVDGLVAGKNQTDAALNAGYCESQPSSAAWRLMKRDVVRAALCERRAEAAHAAGIEAHQILVEIANIAFGRRPVDSDVVRLRALEDLLEYVQTSGAGVDTARVSEEITKRFNAAKARPVYSKPPALQLIAGGGGA